MELLGYTLDSTVHDRGHYIGRCTLCGAYFDYTWDDYTWVEFKRSKYTPKYRRNYFICPGCKQVLLQSEVISMQNPQFLEPFTK